jgi:hypothetical protein
MLFGIEDFLDQFIQWSMWCAAVLTGLMAIVITLYRRWVEFRNRDSEVVDPQPQPIPIGVRTPQRRTDLWSTR